MKIKYLGPSSSVNVAPYGPHPKGQVVDYPDDFAEELLATSKKQRFTSVGQPTAKADAKGKDKK